MRLPCPNASEAHGGSRGAGAWMVERRTGNGK